jgi:hypothetical protein
MSRKREQAEMFVKLGELLGPLKKIAENPAAFDADEQTRILARYFFDKVRFQESFNAFCQSEHGHLFQAQMQSAAKAINLFTTFASIEPESVLGRVPKLWDDLFAALSAIPVPVESSIHAAHTPFSVYCLLQELCTTVKKQIVWLDRYFDHRVFHRFFAETPKSVEIVLVTWPQSKFNSKKDLRRYDELMDVSRLFAQERGVGGYRLVADEDFHARWLRCDDGLFHLGDSISALGMGATFTLSKLDATPENFAEFEAPLTRGTELFGPSQTTHI